MTRRKAGRHEAELAARVHPCGARSELVRCQPHPGLRHIGSRAGAPGGAHRRRDRRPGHLLGGHMGRAPRAHRSATPRRSSSGSSPCDRASLAWSSHRWPARSSAICLLALGLSMLGGGGLKNGTQKFDTQVAGMNGGLLMLAATGLIIPAVFHHSSAARTSARSACRSRVILFAVYLGSLLYTLATSRPPWARRRSEAEVGPALRSPLGGEVGWSRNKAIGDPHGGHARARDHERGTDRRNRAGVARALGLTPVFAGVFLLALVGNIAQVFNAFSFARSR